MTACGTSDALGILSTCTVYLLYTFKGDVTFLQETHLQISDLSSRKVPVLKSIQINTKY